MSDSTELSAPARKLLAIIVDQAHHGPLHPKAKGTATPPEILVKLQLHAPASVGMGT